MKSLFPSAKMLFYSRVSLYFLSLVILLSSVSGLFIHISIMTDYVFNTIDIHVKLNHARTELARLITSCMMFGILLLIRAPLNRKDHAFNTTCHWYGLVFLYSAILFSSLFLLLNLDPPIFPYFSYHEHARIFFWPLVNLLYAATCISFVYRSLQD